MPARTAAVCRRPLKIRPEGGAPVKPHASARFLFRPACAKDSGDISVPAPPFSNSAGVGL
jgi:hypothetical protein